MGRGRESGALGVMKRWGSGVAPGRPNVVARDPMLLTVLNFAGVAVFAASGALIGVRKRLDIFGVWTVAALTGLGGGVVRDVLLGESPPTAFESWESLTVVAVAALAVFIFHPQFAAFRRAVLVLDAFGVALFSASGALMAVHVGTSAVAATLIGITTALGGGVLRDILVNEVPLLIQGGNLQAIPALSGAGVTVLLSESSVGEDWALVAGTVLAFGFRVVAVWRNWNAPYAPDNVVNSLAMSLRRRWQNRDRGSRLRLRRR